MKKSYHSMVVPMVAAITALRSSALWRCSGSESTAWAVVMGSLLRNANAPPTAFVACTTYAHASRATRQLHHAAAQHRELVVLVARLLLDLDQVMALLDVLARHLAVDEQQIAGRIVPADLAGGPAQEAVVAHPVGQMMGEPRAALGAVVVGAGRADLTGELLLPMHALRAVGNAEAVGDAQPGIGVDQLPGELVGAK